MANDILRIFLLSNYSWFRHLEAREQVWKETSQTILYLFQEVCMGCEQVLTGRKLMQCLPSPEDVKMALEVYKLSLEMPIMTLRFFKAVQSTEVLPSTLNLLFHTFFFP